MTKGKRIFFAVLGVIFIIAAVILLVMITRNRYSVDKAEKQCPYIRITAEERSMFALIREDEEIAASMEKNSLEDATIDYELEEGQQLIYPYIPSGAKVEKLQTYSRTILVEYLYDECRIVMSCDSRGVIQKVVALPATTGETVQLFYINDDNRTVLFHESSLET